MRFASTLIRRGSIQKYKKCKFRAHLYDVGSDISDVNDCGCDVRNLDRKHMKVRRETTFFIICSTISNLITLSCKVQATHNIAAWILKTGEEGFDDDGESGAGKRLLSILKRRKKLGYYVSVTRWYGGSHLGTARFRVISNTAKEIIY